MKSEILSQERNIVVVKAEFEASEVDRTVQKTVRELSGKVNIKGFRKGHVPRNMLELYFGKGGIYKEAAEHLAQESLDNIVSEYELDLITEPKLKLGELAEGKPLDLEFTFEVRPEVTLPDLSTLSAEKTIFAVTDDQVDEAFNQILESAAELVALDEDRPVEPSDIVQVEYNSYHVEDDGSASMLEEKKQSTIHLGVETLRSEIAEALAGKKLAEEFSFDVKIEDDYPDKHMAGSMIRYDMEVLQLMKRAVPEPTDEKIQEMSKGKYTTAEELRAELRKQIEENAQERGDATLRESAIKALSEAAEVDVPESMIDRQQNAMRRDQENQVQRDLKQSLDEYLKFNNLSAEEYDSNLRKRAEEIVRNTLVLDALADKEEINFTSEELNEEIVRMAASMGAKPEDLAEALRKNRDEFTALAMRVRNRNTIGHLASKVQVSEVELPKIESAEEPAAEAEEKEEGKKETKKPRARKKDKDAQEAEAES